LHLFRAVEVLSGSENFISPFMANYYIGILLYLKNSFDWNRRGYWARRGWSHCGWEGKGWRRS
jgi:hypothetical protein